MNTIQYFILLAVGTLGFTEVIQRASGIAHFSVSLIALYITMRLIENITYQRLRIVITLVPE